MNHSLSALLPHAPKNYYRLALMHFFFIMGILFSSWAIRIPDIKNALSLSDAELGGILFGAPVGQLLAIAPTAWFVGHIGSRRSIMLGMCAMPTALVMLPVAPGRLWLFAALVFFGFSNNMLNISLNAQAVGVEFLYRRSIMSSFHGMWSVGAVIGGVIGAIVAPMGIPPLPHFGAMFLLSILILVLLRTAIMPRDVRSAAQKKKQSSIRPDLYIILLGVIAFGSFATEGALYDWSAVYFAQVVQVRESLVRVGYVACLSAMVVGRLVADTLVNRYSVVPMLQVSGASIAAGLTLALLSPTLATATTGFALTGFGMASVVPLCFSLAGKSSQVSPQAAISFVASIGYFGLLASPPVVGMLSEWLTLRWALSPMIVIGVAIVFLTAALKRLQAKTVFRDENDS